MQTATKQLWTGVLAAIVGSLCCVAPLVLLSLGISGAWISQLTALEPYRPFFVGVMLVFMGLAFRQLYVVPARCAPAEACANPRLQLVLTCPSCGHARQEIIPTDACQYFYECTSCKALLKPKAGDCCVFCSYGSVVCPPTQEQRSCCH